MSFFLFLTSFMHSL